MSTPLDERDPETFEEIIQVLKEVRSLTTENTLTTTQTVDNLIASNAKLHDEVKQLTAKINNNEAAVNSLSHLSATNNIASGTPKPKSWFSFFKGGTRSKRPKSCSGRPRQLSRTRRRRFPQS